LKGCATKIRRCTGGVGEQGSEGLERKDRRGGILLPPLGIAAKGTLNRDARHAKERGKLRSPVNPNRKRKKVEKLMPFSQKTGGEQEKKGDRAVVSGGRTPRSHLLTH